MRLVTLSLLFVSLVVTQALSQGEPTERPWRIPPAIAGQDGNVEIPRTARIFVGTRAGEIRTLELGLGSQTLTQVHSHAPGSGLPSEVVAVWHLSLPDRDQKPNLVVGIASYLDQSIERYGIVRSTDLGNTWTLLKPSALADPHFKVLNTGKFVGNFYRAPLMEISWLSGGDFGWAWGRKGIVRTTDGGETWSVAYKTANEDDQLVRDYEAVWGLDFHTADSGTAVIGGLPTQQYYTTTDGGLTWIRRWNLNVRRLAHDALDWLWVEYRSIVTDRTQFSNNTSIYESEIGERWTKQSEQIAAVSGWAHEMIEVLWGGIDVGFLLYREGEIWRTEDGGETWSQVQESDPLVEPMPISDGDGAPAAGYGQNSVLIFDGLDHYIVQAVTDNAQGTIRSYIPVWLVDPFTSVPGPGREAAPATVIDISLLPNTTADEVSLSIEVGETFENTVLRIVDGRGEVALHQDLGRIAAGASRIPIDLDRVPSGSYRVLITAGGHSASAPLNIVR